MDAAVVIAPEGFTEHAISENVIAGNAMSRRAIYMYGALLPREPHGGVNGGLGQTTSSGTSTLMLPNVIITKDNLEQTVMGVPMVFQLTPGSEAPAEMNTYFPHLRALWMAENTTNTMHNILTLRGAQVRDALKWASFLDETINKFGFRTDVKFQSHHWPMWGKEKIVENMQKVRDIYKYTHDQSVNMMNKGLTGEEISEEIKLPEELEKYWPTRGYYGTLRHNSRAVYQRYMGWYNGNPSNLNNLPPDQAGPKYVEYMGGVSAVLKRAKKDFALGRYRWVVEVLKHVAFSEPPPIEANAQTDANAQDEASARVEAIALLADALEQLGYQAESGPWRSVYLMGAFELRNGVPKGGEIESATEDVIKAMPPEMLFDYLGVRLNGPSAAGKKYLLNIVFTDPEPNNKKYGLVVENGVLNYGRPHLAADVTLALAKLTLDSIQLKDITLNQAIAEGKAKVVGNQVVLDKFLNLIDTFPFWFNIVTP